MKTIKIFAAGVLAAMLAGCSPSDEIPGGGRLSDEAVRFTAAIETASSNRVAGPETRTTNSGNSWATGDAVGISMLETGTNTAIVANRLYEVTDPTTGALIPAEGDMYYPMEGRVDFAAYYPYHAAADGTLAIDVTDQSDPAALDVLWARIDGVAKGSTPVALDFEHVLSKITFNITLGDGLEELAGDDATTVSFTGMPASATLDLADGSLTAATTPIDFEAMKAATATAPAVASFSALVIPQAAGTAGRKALFSVDSETYTWEIPDTVAFAAGDHYVYPVTVQRTGIIVGAPTIAKWTQNERGTTTPQVIIAEGKTGPLSWVLTPDGTLTISGEGAMPDYSSVYNPAPWREEHADYIKTVFVESGVESIGNHAFYGCTALTSISIPEGASIRTSAFQGCTDLTSISIPEGANIAAGAFYGCIGLKGVTIPEGASIGDNAFRGCTGLKSVTISKGVSIGGNAFYGCTDLTGVIISDGVASIGAGAFQNCSRLKSITIPEGVKNIGHNAFMGCTGLTSVTVLAVEPPELGPFNFVDNQYEDTLYVPAESLEDYKNSPWADVFTTIVDLDGNIAGTTGTLDWVLTSTGTLTISGEGTMPDYDNSINQVPWSAHLAAIKTVVIGSGVTSIGTNAFLSCKDLADITIPGNVTSIGYGAFNACLRLESIVIPDGVPIIEDKTFSGCHSLTSITIPGTVKSIGQGAFFDCRILKSVTILAPTPPDLGTDNFDYDSDTLYVQAESLKDYRNSDWADVFDAIMVIPNNP